MRTIKASEVAKGMRVRVEQPWGPETTRTVEGPIRRVEDRAPHFRFLTIGNGDLTVDPDHPVTVLAEPEPEWVEGAWYRCQVGTNEPENLRRLPHGWSPFHDTERVFHEDDEDITVLGRVLIVDWPGDLAAQSLLVRGATKSPCDSGLPDDVAEAVDNVADAIRTQGGVR